MRNKPTFKQKRFAEEFVKLNGNATQAALRTYNPKNYNSANAIAVENLQKPLVQEEIRDVLNRVGLNLTSISERVRNIAYAEPTKVTDQGVLRAAEMLYKLHGAFPASKSARLNINLSERYKDYKYQDLIKELQATRLSTEKLLSDLGSK